MEMTSVGSGLGLGLKNRRKLINGVPGIFPIIHYSLMQVQESFFFKRRSSDKITGLD